LVKAVVIVCNQVYRGLVHDHYRCWAYACKA
jgi:hypothetical protein